MNEETHRGRSFLVSGIVVPLACSLMILITRPCFTNIYLYVLCVVVISIAGFTLSGIARKSWTGKAFKSSNDFMRRFIVTLIVSVVFSIGAVLLLGQFLAGNAPLLVIFSGKQYIDVDVLVRYFIAYFVLHVAISALALLAIHGD